MPGIQTQGCLFPRAREIFGGMEGEDYEASKELIQTIRTVTESKIKEVCLMFCSECETHHSQ